MNAMCCSPSTKRKFVIEYSLLCFIFKSVFTDFSSLFFLFLFIQGWRHSFSAYYITYDRQLDRVFNVSQNEDPIDNIQWSPSHHTNAVVSPCLFVRFISFHFVSFRFVVVSRRAHIISSLPLYYRHSSSRTTFMLKLLTEPIQTLLKSPSQQMALLIKWSMVRLYVAVM